MSLELLPKPSGVISAHPRLFVAFMVCCFMWVTTGVVLSHSSNQTVYKSGCFVPVVDEPVTDFISPTDTAMFKPVTETSILNIGGNSRELDCGIGNQSSLLDRLITSDGVGEQCFVPGDVNVRKETVSVVLPDRFVTVREGDVFVACDPNVNIAVR